MCVKVKNYLYQTKIRTQRSHLFLATIKQLIIKNTFNKQERLCSKKQIDHLFNKGSSGNAYPVRLMCIDTEEALNYPAQVMFVAPKRIFKRAHDRNKIKRRMREAYRLNKAEFYTMLNTTNKKALLAFIYTGKKIEEYKVIETAILKLIEKKFKRID